jgi:hypothetical protein
MDDDDVLPHGNVHDPSARASVGGADCEPPLTTAATIAIYHCWHHRRRLVAALEPTDRPTTLRTCLLSTQGDVHYKELRGSYIRIVYSSEKGRSSWIGGRPCSCCTNPTDYLHSSLREIQTGKEC